MNKTHTILTSIKAALLGAAMVFLVVVAGNWIGVFIENRTGMVVVSYELAVVAAWVLATPGGVLVAVAGVLSKRWWRGLAIGLVIHGVYFAFVLLTAHIPLAVNCWIYTVGTIAGGAAGAVGGAVGQTAFQAATSDQVVIP
jgi:hypothetical protein